MFLSGGSYDIDANVSACFFQLIELEQWVDKYLFLTYGSQIQNFKVKPTKEGLGYSRLNVEGEPV